LLGYPVFEDENMPDIGANSLSIAFGNFARGYTIVDRAGVKLLRDPFTNKPLVRLYTTKRVGGDVNDYWSIKLLKFST
jgi:HK97 family phage major capsid protein